MRKPSVTKLVDMLDKPALVRWANRQGLLGIDIDKERQRTKAAGTSMHEQIETGAFVEQAHARNFGRFMEGKEILRSEGAVETEWFVGRYDCKMRVDGLDYIIDYKSSQAMYFETRLQLVAYAMAEPCDRLAMVSVPDFYMIEANMADRAKYEDILIALAKIYALRWQIEHAC